MDITESFLKISRQLSDYRIRNAATLSQQEERTLRAQEEHICLQQEGLLADQAWKEIQNVSEAQSALENCTAKMEHQAACLQKVQSVLDMAAVVIGIGSSLISLNVGGMLDGVASLNAILAG